MARLQRNATGPRRGGSSARDLGVTIDADALLKLKRDLAGIDRKLVTELRKGLKAAAQPVLRRAKSNASWSTRIPSAIKLTTKFTNKRTGVFLEVDRKKAPHGRAYEFGSDKNGSGRLRHPVYADPNKSREDWTWVEQDTRPFFFKAVDGEEAAINRAVEKVMDDIARKAGFK